MVGKMFGQREHNLCFQHTVAAQQRGQVRKRVVYPFPFFVGNRQFPAKAKHAQTLIRRNPGSKLLLHAQQGGLSDLGAGADGMVGEAIGFEVAFAGNVGDAEFQGARQLAANPVQ